MCKVTVAMAVHDAIPPRYASEAIESILNQTFKDLGISIVVDGSVNEKLSRVLAGYADLDKRVRILSNEKSLGLPACLNRIIETTDSDYVARMDADDVSLPERIQRQIDFLEGHPQTDLVGTFAYEIDEEGRVLFRKKMPINSADVRRLTPRRNPFIHPTVVFRRRFFDKAGLYRSGFPLTEDLELWIRALAQGIEGSNIPEFLYQFRIDKRFWSRRRGFAFALAETRLRVGSIRRLGLPAYNYLFPPAQFMFRMSPAPVLRFMYEHFR